LDTKSSTPPYQQLLQQVRQAVMVGHLREGDRLPLIRELAEELAINPNTVAKAYKLMEHEQLVIGRPGQGTFVLASQASAVPPGVYASLRRGLEAWLRRAYAAGLERRTVDALFSTVHQDVSAEGAA
jgi:GntR family transcriptional regulator